MPILSAYMTIRASRRWFCIPVGWILTVGLAFAGLAICPQCGYENAAGVATCTHCRGALPGTKPDEPAAPAPEAKAQGPESGYLDMARVDTEIEAGRVPLKEGRAELARLLFRNAAALAMLTDPSREAEGVGRLPALMRACDAQVPAGRCACPVCGGSGEVAMGASAPPSGLGGREGAAAVCARCRGKGELEKPLTVDRRKRLRVRALQEYRVLQASRRYVPVGNAWVPADVEQGLDVRHVGWLRRATAAPCPSCIGIGREDCETCRGAGEVACRGKGCVNGRVPIETGKGAIGSELKRTRICAACGGRGTAACARCVGAGDFPCARCRGTGEREACRTCAGNGLVPCRRCKGGGTWKSAACPDCGGGGVSLCASCNGEGRRE